MKPILRRMVLAACATIKRDVGGKIIFHHDIYDKRKYYEHATPVDLFCKQCDAALGHGWRFVNRTPRADHELQVCFDDGYRGVLDCLDMLSRYKISPTINVAVDLIGAHGYLTKEEILDLQKEGFSFQSHTWSHGYLPECTEEELSHELADAKCWLEDLLQNPVSQICFPRGLFSHKVYDMSIKAGYLDLVSSIPGSVKDVRNLPARILPRTIVQGCSASEALAVIEGGMSFFQKRYIQRHVKDWKLSADGGPCWSMP